MVGKLTSTVLLSLMEVALVDGLILPGLDPVTVLLIHGPLTFVHGAVAPPVEAHAVRHIVVPGALVVAPVSIDHAALPGGRVVLPVPLIHRAVRPVLDALAIAFSILPLADIDRP